MDIREITSAYFVAPQIDPSHLPAIAAAGIKTVICNRPDGEVPAAFQATVMEQATKAAGLSFVDHPVTHQSMTLETVTRQQEVIQASDGPVLAYCASGTRSTIVWALGVAGDLSVTDIVAAARKGGYDLENMRPTLEAIAQSR